MRFAKGHGTGNDFVILPDPDGALDLPPELVARICDRRRGVGADGVLRVVRSAAAGPAAGAAQAAAAGAQWFMDYRNADGSIAEMCGNGLRVFARYLLASGLAGGPSLAVGTRAGVREVRESAAGDGWLAAEMGPARVTGTGSARVGARDCTGLAVCVGNPHLVCLTDVPVEEFDLSAAPALAAGEFPDGANVEIVRVTGDRHARMRVYERGSGVTLSCGTGAVAAAVGAAVAAGEWQSGAEHCWTVDVPGGRLAVTPSATASQLAGPAVIVAAGELDEAWLRARSGIG
jgi:diaminopimelate epimerase